MKTLNDSQGAAIESKAANILCVACPGSGKTLVLTHRIAHLVRNERTSPANILAITFTRKAAREIRERLGSMLGCDIEPLETGTIHAVCYQMAKRWREELGYSHGHISVYSDWQTKQLIKFAAEDVGFYKRVLQPDGSTKTSWRKAKAGDIYAAVQRYGTTGAMPDDGTPGRQVLDRMIGMARESHAFTYDMLINAAVELLSRNGKVAPYYRGIWKHVLVDEAQDLDRLQWLFVRLAAGENLFMVGDPDQSIYGWRGGDPRILTEFAGEPTTCVLPLAANYRSGAGIVEVCNKLISHGPDRIGGPAAPFLEGSGRVYTFHGRSAQVAAEVRCLTDGSEALAFEPGDVGVLARTNAMAKKVHEELLAAGVPAIWVGTLSDEEQEAEEVFNAALRVLWNPFDNFSFRCALPLFGIDEGKYYDIQRRALAKGLPEVAAAFGEDAHKKGLPESIYLEDALGALTATVVFTSQPGLYEGVLARIRSWAARTGATTLEAYIDWLAIRDMVMETAETEANAVKVMTVHHAKGCEWPAVVVVGFNEGLFPCGSGENMDLDEERRVAYVACTRAGDLLSLNIRDTYIDEYGKTREQVPSRFLAEMGIVI